MSQRNQTLTNAVRGWPEDDVDATFASMDAKDGAPGFYLPRPVYLWAGTSSYELACFDRFGL